MKMLLVCAHCVLVECYAFVVSYGLVHSHTSGSMYA